MEKLRIIVSEQGDGKEPSNIANPIEILPHMEIWEVLKCLREPSIFDEDTPFREMGGHFDEGENLIWITVGIKYLASFGLRIEDGKIISPLQSNTVNTKQKNILRNPVLFHTHPDGYRFSHDDARKRSKLPRRRSGRGFLDRLMLCRF